MQKNVGPKAKLNPGEYMDGTTIMRRCKGCGAALVKGKCPLSRKDCRG